MNNIDHHIPLVLYLLVLMLLYIDQMVISNIVVALICHIAGVVMFYIAVVMMIVVVMVMTTVVNNQFVGCIVNWIVFPQRDLPHRMHEVIRQIVVVLMVSMIQVIRMRKVRAGYRRVVLLISTWREEEDERCHVK